MLSEQRQEAIRQAVAAGRRVNRQASGRVTLPTTGTRYEILATPAGPTAAGAFYRELTGVNHGQHGLGGDEIIRSGNNEYLHPGGGQRKLLRSLLPSGGFRYTRAGQRYFQEHALYEYVVGIPVKTKHHPQWQTGWARAL